MTCYRFLLFGRAPHTSNRLAHGEHFLFSNSSIEEKECFKNALSNSMGVAHMTIFYHSINKSGMSKKAVACYKSLSSSSASNKELAEKLSWDNLYSSLLTECKSELVELLESPDAEYYRSQIIRKMKNKAEEGIGYFELKEGNSSSSVLRFYLCDSHHFLNQKIFDSIPETIRALPTSLKKHDLQVAKSSRESYANYFHNSFLNNIWVLSTKDYNLMPFPRIQQMFNRLVQEGSFANSGSIPKFLLRMKSLFQLNSIPQETMRLLGICKEHEYIQLHSHHIDDIHEPGVLIENIPMVSVFFDIIHVGKYNFTFIFPFFRHTANKFLDSF